jgi:hypothetical protein
VIESKLASGSVSNAKLQGGLDASKLAFGTLNPTLLPDGSISASKLASYLDLSTKSVSVSSYPSDFSSAVNAGTASAYAVGAVNDFAAERNIPAKFASGSRTATPSSGLITVDLTDFNFIAAPVVTANIYQPGSTKFVVGIQSVSETQVQFKVLTSSAANATVSTRIDWQAVSYGV